MFIFSRCRWLVLLLGVLPASFVLADFKDAQEALKAKDYDAAASEFRALAGLGNAAATYAYADMLYRGQGADADPVAALAWFELARDQGNDRAEKRVRNLSRSLDESGKADAATQAAELIALMGQAAISERWVPGNQDREGFQRKFSRSPDHRVPKRPGYRFQATVVEFDFDISPQGVPRDFQLVGEVWTPLALYVFDALRKERYRDAAGAFAWHHQALYATSDTREQYGAGKILRKLRKRAESGSPYRKFYYAHAQELAENFGYENSPRDSNDWYLQAAQGGYAKAQYVVGYRTLFGFTLDQDHEKGLRWIHLAAANGNARANYLLARVLMGSSDQAAVKSHFERAAEAGHTTAMLWLARILAEEGDAAAQTWLEKAVDHLDQVSWHLVAAVVFAEVDPAQSAAHRDSAAQLARELDIPDEPLTPLTWETHSPT